MGNKTYTYWLNANRPEVQFRTNGRTCWLRRVGEENWKWHEAPLPTFPSQWRTIVTLAELDENREVPQ